MNMSSNRLGELIRIADEVTNKKFGYSPYDRPIKELLNYGIILLDKPGGPTSHEVVAWVKRILELEKAGHSGTLDPGATGLLPIGLGDATKALSVLLLGPKEYYAIARLLQVMTTQILPMFLPNLSGRFINDPHRDPL